MYNQYIYYLLLDHPTYYRAVNLVEGRMTPVDIAEQFKKLRTDKGRSVYWLSKEADISENHIHKIERGESQPTITTLEKLLTCLGVTLAEFFNGDTSAVYPSDFEKELLRSVRVLPEENADVVLQLAKDMKE